MVTQLPSQVRMVASPVSPSPSLSKEGGGTAFPSPGGEWAYLLLPCPAACP